MKHTTVINVLQDLHRVIEQAKAKQDMGICTLREFCSEVILAQNMAAADLRRILTCDGAVSMHDETLAAIIDSLVAEAA